MSFASGSLMARLIVGGMAFMMLMALIITSFQPLLSSFLDYRKAHDRSAITKTQLDEFRLNPVIDYDLSLYESAVDVETFSHQMASFIRQSANRSELMSVQLQPVDLASGVSDDSAYQFIWFQFQARGDLVSLDAFISQLGNVQPQYLVQSLHVEDERSDDPGMALLIEMRVGQLWFAQVQDEGAQSSIDQSTQTALSQVRAGMQMLWIDRSPFDADHARFERPVEIIPPPPPPPPASVRLLGLSQQGGQYFASLEIEGREVTVQMGDDTVAGRVLEISSAEIVFEGTPPRRVSLFD